MGVPLGIFINYLFCFPTINIPIPESFVERVARGFVFFMSFLIIPCMTTMTFLVLLFKKVGKLNLRCFIRAFWSVIVFLLILPVYVVITYEALDVMLGGELATMRHVLFNLLITPFVILFVAVFVPDSRVGAVLYRFMRRLKKSSK